jgi:hypothetical protein
MRNIDPVETAFNLQENPFAGRYYNTLTPAAVIDLNRLYVFVDGLQKSLSDIERWLTSLSANPRPVVGLIVGPKGSGRSSAARYVAYRYALLLQNGPKTAEAGDLLRRSYVDARVQDEHPVAPVWDLLSACFHHALELGVSLNTTIIEVLLKEASDTQRKALTFYKTIYTMLRTDIKNKIDPLVFCLEDVRNIHQIMSATAAVGSQSMLLCTTTIDTVAQEFAIEVKRGELNALKLALTKLAPDDVFEIVTQRWRVFSSGGVAPISKDVIKATFREWPIRGVVLMLGEALTEHARQWAEAGNAPPPPPMTQKDLMASIIRVLDERGQDFTR